MQGARRVDRVRGHDPLEAIGAKVSVDAAGCWIFEGNRNPQGYGLVAVHGTQRLVHRFVYESTRRLLEPGEVLHHKCGVKPCCNPDHLEPMSQSGHAAHHAPESAERGALHTLRTMVARYGIDTVQAMLVELA